MAKRKQINNSKEREAINRMGIIGLSKEEINKFTKEKKTLIAYGEGIFLPNNLEQALITKFEEKYKCLAYYGMRSIYRMSDESEVSMLSLLYVSSDEQEWVEDNEMLKDGESYAMVYNLSDEALSEIGMINFKMENGILIRTA